MRSLNPEASSKHTEDRFAVSHILNQDRIQNLKNNIKRGLKVEKIDFDEEQQTTTSQLDRPTLRGLELEQQALTFSKEQKDVDKLNR